jgi:phage/plasmid-associated DNA primase
VDTLQKMDHSEDKYEAVKKRINKLSDLCVLLKKTPWKNNIMREAKELFYNKDFMNKLDQNPYLLCFNNYVIDFEQGTHRIGMPDDYISKSTNIEYIPLDKITDTQSIQEVTEFMEQLFPDEELRRYMWEHLASTLIGNNDNQTFNIYI